MCLCVQQSSPLRVQGIFTLHPGFHFLLSLITSTLCRQAASASNMLTPATNTPQARRTGSLPLSSAAGIITGSGVPSTTQKEHAPFNCSNTTTHPQGTPTAAKPPRQTSRGQGVGTLLARTPQTPTVLTEFQ